MVDFAKIKSQTTADRLAATVECTRRIDDLITKQQRKIAFCVEHESRLADWPRSFIDSISVQSANGRFLSDKQVAKLNEIVRDIQDELTDEGIDYEELE